MQWLGEACRAEFNQDNNLNSTVNRYEYFKKVYYSGNPTSGNVGVIINQLVHLTILNTCLLSCRCLMQPF